jgi:hypothetical protein
VKKRKRPKFRRGRSKRSLRKSRSLLFPPSFSYLLCSLLQKPGPASPQYDNSAYAEAADPLSFLYEIVDVGCGPVCENWDLPFFPQQRLLLLKSGCN